MPLAYPKRIIKATCSIALCSFLTACNQETHTPSPETQAPSTAPQRPVDIGRQHLGAGRYAEALSSLGTALENTPGEQSIQRDIARAYLALGRYDSAQTHIERALETNADRAELYDVLGAIHMARAFSQAHYRDTDQALAAFQKAVDLDSARAHAHYNIGLVCSARTLLSR